MPTELVVRFTGEAAGSGELKHRVRNFAEDLDRSLSQASLGRVKNMDEAVNAVVVSVKARRLMGDAKAIANAELRRHRLYASAVLEL